MRKVLLINPGSPRTVSTKPVLRYDPPVGLLNLATYLRPEYEAEILDTSLTRGLFTEDVFNGVQRGRYLLVGISVLVGEFFKNAVLFTEAIKKLRPGQSIVWGNAFPSAFADDVLKTYPVDYVVRGEGEKTLKSLCDYLSLKPPQVIDDIPGLSFRYMPNGIYHNPDRPGEPDLGTYPVPNWSFLPINREQVPYYFRLNTSMGCPFHCSFCYGHADAWRTRPAWHVIEEMERINKTTGATVFTFGDDNFFGNTRRAIEIFDWMRAKQFYVEQALAHLNALKPAVIDAMGGVVQTISYSIETASKRLQATINKHLNPDHCVPMNIALYQKGITTIQQFISGLPTETDEDMRENVLLMLKLKAVNPYVRAVTTLLYPIPGTPIWGDIERMGYKLPQGIEPHVNAFFYTWKYKERHQSEISDGREFRPWLDEERYAMVNAYCEVFNDVFQQNNIEVAETTFEHLKNFPALRKIFAGIEDMRRPKEYYHPYVLDRVLAGENIDLLNDLRERVEF